MNIINFQVTFVRFSPTKEICIATCMLYLDHFIVDLQLAWCFSRAQLDDDFVQFFREEWMSHFRQEWSLSYLV